MFLNSLRITQSSTLPESRRELVKHIRFYAVNPDILLDTYIEFFADVNIENVFFESSGGIDITIPARLFIVLATKVLTGQIGDYTVCDEDQDVRLSGQSSMSSRDMQLYDLRGIDISHILNRVNGDKDVVLRRYTGGGNIVLNREVPQIKSLTCDFPVLLKLVNSFDKLTMLEYVHVRPVDVNGQPDITVEEFRTIVAALPRLNRLLTLTLPRIDHAGYFAAFNLVHFHPTLRNVTSSAPNYRQFVNAMFVRFERHQMAMLTLSNLALPRNVPRVNGMNRGLASIPPELMRKLAAMLSKQFAVREGENK